MASRPRYDDVADFYINEVGDDVSDPATAALLDLVGDVRGARILDVACGQGRVTRELARRGARVTGTDISAALIGKARDAESARPLGVTYGVRSATDSGGLEPESFDGAVCNYGLSDIDDLAGALYTIGFVLRSGGFFVLSILHPCFPGWGAGVSSSWPTAGGYFDEGWWRTEAPTSRLRREVGANHRTLSTYLNELVRRHLAIEMVCELPPPQQWLMSDPAAPAVPTFLVIRCVKWYPVAG